MTSTPKMAGLTAAVLLLALPAVAAAQADGREAPPVHAHAMILGGASGMGEASHRYAGLEAGLFRGRLGAMGLAQAGDGNGYRSVLAAAGPALEVADIGFGSLLAYAGLGHYSETESSGVNRGTTVGFGGTTLRVPVGFGVLGLSLTLWRGTMEGGEVVTPFPIAGYRLSAGFGL
jgi:hypothetical protein